MTETSVTGVPDGYSTAVTSAEDTTTGVVTYTVTNTLGETPEIEKYVNKDVHAELGAFDTSYEYELVAYVTKDADEVQITDTLNGAVKFVGDSVAVVDLGTTNDHTVNGTVADAGTAVTATTGIAGQTLTVSITGEAAKAVRGHYVKVSFSAELDIDTWAEYTAAAQEVTENTPVQGGAASHKGIPNAGEYKIKVGNEWKYNDKSNPVTVTPPTVDISVEKVWKNGKGTTLEWPKDATVTVQLMKQTGTGEPEAVEGKSLTLDADRTTGTFEKLPVLTGVTYSVIEASVTGVPAEYEASITKAAGTENYTVTNTMEEEPEIEKYVEKDVHYDLGTFQETYTYDLVAYVTKDADEIEITDTLENTLVFDGDATVTDLGETNNHTAGGTVSEAGTPVAVTPTVTGQKLTVSISGETAKGLRGHYVKVSFDAKLAFATWEEYEAATKQTVTDNTPVITGINEHTGIANDGEYRIKVGNKWDYEDQSNPVTVTPPTVDISVEKVWKNGKGTTLEWPKDATVTVQLMKQTGTGEPEAVEGKSLTLDADRTTGTFEKLPVLTGVTYSVIEASVTGVPAEYEASITKAAGTENYTVTNTMEEEPEIEKYVEKDVHYDLSAFDETYTYDLVAYVTKDADVVEFTDTLGDALTFAGTEADVKVVDLGTTNDHKVRGTVTKAGKAVKADVNIEGKTLTVTIADATSLRGHYVKVTFDAKLTIETVADYEKWKASVSDNTPVIGGAASHEGIPNTGEYRIKVGNDWDYKEESNTVTVTPGTGSLKVSKIVSGGTATDNAKSFHFTVQLSDKTLSGVYGEMTFTNGVASFDLKHGESKTATGLPTNVTYAVKEDSYDGYTTTSTGAAGVISKGTTHEAAFTNTVVTTTPTPTPTPTPRPGGGVPVPPGPTPVPRIDIEGTKVWNDQGNVHKVRPGSIDVILLADGVPVDAQPVWVSKSGDNWSFRFENLPQYDSDDELISYTVQERPVQYYTTAISGTVITNSLEERPPERYIDLAGQKTWVDNDNAEGKRPASITVHLLRDGEIISTLTVTTATDWKYEFKDLPADDGYGHVYTYTIDEETVPGYYKRVNGMNLTNGLLPGGDVPNVPDEPTEIPERGGTPAPNYEGLSDEELEELFDMFGYGTPLYGMLGTGDETPLYPFVFGGIGLLALTLLLVLKKRGKA